MEIFGAYMGGQLLLQSTENCKFNTSSCEQQVKRHISKHTSSEVMKSGDRMISIKRNDEYMITLL